MLSPRQQNPFLTVTRPESLDSLAQAFVRTWAKDQSVFMKAGEQTVEELNLAQLTRYLAHIKEESSEVSSAALKGDSVELLDGLIDLAVVTIGAIHSLGVDPDEVWDIIYRANMRKIVDGRVYRRPDGQIGKPPGWYGPDVELIALLEANGVIRQLSSIISSS